MFGASADGQDGAQNAYVAEGWKAGDQAGWEQHLKVRTQRGQNDYYGRKN